MQDKYGINTYLESDKINKIRNNFEIQQKIQNSKRNNNTFNSSLIEFNVFQILKSKFKDIRTQYKSELYPFNCDFYIGDIDLYLECNFHWTHGFHPFDETNENDLKILNIWKEKSIKSKFYRNAITTWTIRDVNKRKIAKKNNINFLEIWKINDLNQLKI